MGRKWKAPRCPMSNKPAAADAKETGGLIGQKQCPRCRRSFYVKDNGKWPTHGVAKMSFKYGE